MRTLSSGDKYTTHAGDIYIDLLGHGSLMITWTNKVIHIDPYGQAADYVPLAAADLILITHDHYDHFDRDAIEEITESETQFIGPESIARLIPEAKILRNGEKTRWEGLKIEAVPAYNLQHKRPDGSFFHPKGPGNGYILHFADFRVYIAGDTENIPEMADFSGVDVAFLPKNLPYTMSDEMFVDAAKRLKPKVLYVYHHNDVDYAQLQEAIGPNITLK